MAHISAPPRVTSVDVARRAGVSQSTVSLVLSGKARGRISARTEEAVRAAAQELGYRPNVAARALRTGVARSVALVVPTSPTRSSAACCAAPSAPPSSAGYTVVLVDIGNDRAWEAASLQALLAGPADGLLLFEVELPPGRDRARDPDRDAPRRAPRRPARRRGAASTARSTTCSALGHTRIGHVASSFDAPTFDLRRERMRARLGDAPPTVAGAVHLRGRRRGRRRRCSTQGGFTAVFCDDDILAGGVYLAARERGIAIPGDLSVVGFDDLDFARVLAPPLTTVASTPRASAPRRSRRWRATIAGETVEREQVMPVAARGPRVDRAAPRR